MARPAFIYHPDYEIDIGRHVFPTQKFRLFRDGLVARGLASEGEIEIPQHATDEELLLALEPEYLAELRGYKHTPATMRSELPISRSIVEGVVATSGGTIACVEHARTRPAAFHIGGGFHHGYADRAEGFCYINDVAVGAAYAIARAGFERVAVIDTDVHQGNGTAAIFASEPRVFTFSIHQEQLYPYPKERSDWDIGLPVACGDEAYIAALEPVVPAILDEFRPELVLYVAGVDPYEGDQLGDLGLTFEGMRRREEVVLAPLVRAGVPFVTVTGGGYARNLEDTVALHVQTVEMALSLLTPR